MTTTTTADFKKNIDQYLTQTNSWDFVSIENNGFSYIILPQNILDEEDLAALSSKKLKSRITKSRKAKRYSLQDTKELFNIW